MAKIQYQVSNRRNSSPTLEVGVFLLKEDKYIFLVSIKLFFILMIFYHIPKFTTIKKAQ